MITGGKETKGNLRTLASLKVFLDNNNNKKSTIEEYRFKSDDTNGNQC